jgi:3,4-dihydroxy-2-butanone 4-phosphate synthase
LRRTQETGISRQLRHTEAAVDLARLSGFEPAGALCELMAEDGSMLRGAELERFAQAHELPFLTIADLVGYRRASEPQTACAAAGDALLEHFLLPHVQA